MNLYDNPSSQQQQQKQRDKKHKTRLMTPYNNNNMNQSQTQMITQCNTAFNTFATSLLIDDLVKCVIIDTSDSVELSSTDDAQYNNRILSKMIDLNRFNNKFFFKARWDIAFVEKILRIKNIYDDYEWNPMFERDSSAESAATDELNNVNASADRKKEDTPQILKNHFIRSYGHYVKQKKSNSIAARADGRDSIHHMSDGFIYTIDPTKDRSSAVFCRCCWKLWIRFKYFENYAKSDKLNEMIRQGALTEDNCIFYSTTTLHILHKAIVRHNHDECLDAFLYYVGY